MNENKCFTIPAGYIVLSRAEYDDIVEQRIASRLDRCDEQKELEEKAAKWQTKYIESTTKLGRTIRELEESKAREKETAYKLFQANEQILSMKRELQSLYDELCLSDEIKEVPNAVSETPRNSL